MHSSSTSRTSARYNSPLPPPTARSPTSTPWLMRHNIIVIYVYRVWPDVYFMNTNAEPLSRETGWSDVFRVRSRPTTFPELVDPSVRSRDSRVFRPWTLSKKRAPSWISNRMNSRTHSKSWLLRGKTFIIFSSVLSDPVTSNVYKRITFCPVDDVPRIVKRRWWYRIGFALHAENKLLSITQQDDKRDCRYCAGFNFRDEKQILLIFIDFSIFLTLSIADMFVLCIVRIR